MYFLKGCGLFLYNVWECVTVTGLKKIRQDLGDGENVQKEWLEMG